MIWLWILFPLVLVHLWAWLKARPVLRFQLLFDLVLAVIVGPALWQGGDLNPVHCLDRNRPYEAWHFAESTEFQPTQSDLVLQFHPWWEAARRQMKQGKLPLVDELSGGGLPLLANGQTCVLAPMHLPVWVLGPERGTTVMAAWKLELAGLGAFLFLWRGWRLKPLAAAVAGIAFGASTYEVAWLLVPLSWVVASSPWVWWAIMLALKRRSAWYIVGAVGLGLGWLLGSGLHPETAAIVVGSGLMAGLIFHPQRWLRLVAVFVVAAVSALVLSWPTVGYISGSARLHQTRNQKPNRIPLPLEMRLQGAAQSLVPAIHGHPGRGAWRASYPHPPGAIGIGGAALALAVAGAYRRRYRRLAWAAAAAIAVGIVLVFRVPPLDMLLVRLPPIDRMTLPRFAALIPWGLSILAGLGMQGLLEGRRRPRIALILPVLLALVALASSPWQLAIFDSVLVGFTVIAAFAVVFLGSQWRIAFVTAELSLLAVGINPVAHQRDRIPTPEPLAELVRLQVKEGGRIIGVGGVLPSNLAERSGLPDLRAYNPLRPQPFAQMMALLGEPEPVLGGPLKRAPADLLAAWSVKFLIAGAEYDAAGWTRAWTKEDYVIWKNPRFLPEIRVAGETISISENADDWAGFLETDIDFSKIALLSGTNVSASATVTDFEFLGTPSDRTIWLNTHCDGPCLVVVARPWAPGWKARVNGKPVPVLITNFAGMGVMANGGEAIVELSYHPWLW